MMKLFYLSSVCESSPYALGVQKKILSQVDVFQRSGIKTFLGYFLTSTQFVIYHDGQIISEFTRDKKDGNIYNFIQSFLYSNEIKFVYSRWETFSFSISMFYMRISKKGVKVFLEIPTYPLTQRYVSIRTDLKKGSYIKALRKIYSASIKSIGIPFMKIGVKRIVTNNNYDVIWGIPTIRIHNAVDLKRIRKRRKTTQSRILRIISVANISNWHGYDRLIEGLFYYYKKKNQGCSVYYTLVGDGAELDSIISLVKKYELEDYVSFKGLLFGKDLDDVFDSSDLAVSVLGVHRAGMRDCDSLKSREYCARGIPFITSFTEKAYKNCEFVIQIPDIESPIDISRLIEEYDDLNKRIDVQKKMEDFALKACTWDSAMKNVIAFLNEK